MIRELQYEMANDLERALRVVVDAYGGSLDKLGRPEILHPLNVMMRCGNSKSQLMDIRLKILALLHDVPENSHDPEGELGNLVSMFGAWLHVPLDLLTHKKGQTYGIYIDAITNNKMATYVKIRDIQHNMSRMDGIDPIEADRMRKKYEAALFLLE